MPSAFRRYSVAAVVSAMSLLFGCGQGQVSGLSEEEASRAVTATGCGGLKVGQILAAGKRFASCDGKYFLTLQTNGNLILSADAGRVALWSTGTTSGTGSYLAMQDDGNLVVYSAQGKAVWATMTNGHRGATATVQTDGNLVVYDAKGKALWDANSSPANIGPNGLNPGAVMHAGTLLYSRNKQLRLVLQGDGNLVLYRGGAAQWATSTYRGSKTTATMQWDGNLVVRDGSGKALWSTGTSGQMGAALAIQDDGRLIVYSRAWSSLWISKNNLGGGTPPAPPAPPTGTLDVPAALVSQLNVKPYVEESCTAVDATSLGWPYAAMRCSYAGQYSVTVADPSADRVARWVVDSSKMIPALDSLYARDRAHWEQGLAVIANHTLMQSGRIFPLDGTVAEDGFPYQFHHGVTSTCSTGCYCRINSVSRPEWCHYAAAVYGQSYSSCIATNGNGVLRTAWEDHCLANHKAAWNSDRNDDYRAQAWSANQGISSEFPSPAAASGAAVVSALKDYFGS